MRVSVSQLHAERLPDACSPLFITLHDEAKDMLSVVLRDDQHVVITIPLSIKKHRVALRSEVKRHREIAVDCLKELRNGEQEVHTTEFIYESRQGEVDEGNSRRIGIRRALRKVVPDLRMWPVRLKPWWQRTALAEYAAPFGAWMLLVGIDCTLAVVSGNWMILLCPPIFLAMNVFPVMIGYCIPNGTWWSTALLCALAVLTVIGVYITTLRLFIHMPWPWLTELGHSAINFVIYCAVLPPTDKIWAQDEFPLAISVCTTDGLFRLHGSRVWSEKSWHCAVQLSQIQKFHSFCHSPYTLNKIMGKYYVQVQRSDFMENSYVSFRSKDITTHVVPMLNHALYQWRQLQATHTSYGTVSLFLYE
ncbi:hypothetical protein BWQ96_09766 [Gracilariopsis chorda]|uniref:Uncharacterized protein n=1 Tax=Gracilariopsis chorda TaxID=448386 RepID=A0A2V3IEL7_9FLOR|nr:hypothetical protein BWQ96_09766 [Gracilariopsis chorda]|eukprot:PXF40529.1 hypothetical protein BWQ96_09766 [Gracilariopsis chorda]